MFLLEVHALEGLIMLIYAVWTIPPIILIIMGLFKLNKSKDTSKVLFITAIIYFLVCLGVCGGMMV